MYVYITLVTEFWLFSGTLAYMGTRPQPSYHLTGMLETLLTPNHRCICPSANYTCLVYSATEISWKTVGEYELIHTNTSPKDEKYVEVGGYQVTFTKGPGEDNFSSSLHIRDLGLNGTNLAIVGSEDQKLTNTTTVCIYSYVQCLGTHHNSIIDRTSLSAHCPLTGV